MMYLAGSVLQAMKLGGQRDYRSLILLLGLGAVLAHLVSALGVIRSASGYQFGVVEISTLIAASISGVVLLSSLRKPLDNLFLGLFPLAIVTILASLFLESDYPPTSLEPAAAGHVLSSILAYSLMSIAALQAAFLAYQNRQLKTGHAGGILSRFPPLQDMEAFLFELLWAGQLLLSVGIIAGVLFMDDIWSMDGIIHKTFFSILAWCVFAVLLWGRHQQGWRGRTAIRFTLSGFSLLLVGFYGSKIVLEYMIS